MIRTSLSAVVVLALASAVVVGEAKAEDAKEPFRVSGRFCRSGRQVEDGPFATLEEARNAAVRLHDGGKGPANVRVEVGPGGATGEALAYRVYARSCSRSAWALRETVTDAKKAEEVGAGLRKTIGQVEIVHDFTVKEVFHVVGGNCSRSLRLLATYVSAQEACNAAAGHRAKGLVRCQVDVGTKGEAYPPLRIAQYRVYARSGRLGWALDTTTRDESTAQTVAQARVKGGGQAEVVREFAAK